jgi:hypothetical protein
MNSLVIILGIVIIFFIYLLFKYLTNTATTLSPTADFTKAVPTITGDSLVGATNLSYAHGVWLYVQNWDPSVEKTIFYRPNNIKLYLDSNTPTLKCDIAMQDGSPEPTKTILITNNFPLQKWVYIIVSVDNQFVDVYLDGKLVISQQAVSPKIVNGVTTMYTPKQPGTSTEAPLYLGNSGIPDFKSGSPGVSIGSGWSANALIFTRWTTAVDPQTAWDWYMKGNGKSKFAGMFGSYGVNYSVLKDNIAIINNQPLF